MKRNATAILTALVLGSCPVVGAAPKPAAKPEVPKDVVWVETPRSRIKRVLQDEMLVSQQVFPRPDAHVDARDGTLELPGIRFLRWNEQGYEEYMWEKDRSTMVLVPEGAFRQGLAAGEWFERPVRKVKLQAYLIDKYEVSVDQYARFLSSFEHRLPRHWEEMEDQATLPVTGVSWDDASQYAFWSGKQLPTEAQWERAALGTDNRLFPWGNQVPAADRANYDLDGTRPAGEWKRLLKGRGSFVLGASPIGAFDMAGNVAEWCQDWYAETSYKVTPPEDPAGPSSGERRCVRGGSFLTSAPDQLQGARRGSDIPQAVKLGLGFRTAIPVAEIEAAVKRVAVAEAGIMKHPQTKIDVPMPITPEKEPVPGVQRPLDAPDLEGFQYQRKNSEGFHEYLFLRDRFVMVLVPGGSFPMGSADELDQCERPVHQVQVDSFLMAKYETTVKDYGKFLLATGHEGPEIWTKILRVPESAMAFVGWDDAAAYAEWCGMRLPTEAEWEFAARGSDGRVFPWGDQAPDATRAVAGRPFGGNEDETRAEVPGRLPDGASPYGIYDMAGNLWEWTDGWFVCGYEAPDGSATGETRVVRGGSWRDEPGNFLKATTRGSFAPGERLNHVGVRVVMSLPKRVGAFR